MVTYPGGQAILSYLTSTQAAYIGLSTTAPNEDGTNFSEPTETYTEGDVIKRRFINGYERSQYGGTQTKMGPVEENEITNKEIIFFPEATGSWGTMLYFGLFASNDPATLPLVTGALTDSVNIPANYVPLFRVGNLTLSIQ